MFVTISLPFTYMTISLDRPILSTLHANPHAMPPQNVARLCCLIPTAMIHIMHIAPVGLTDSICHCASGPHNPTTLSETEPTWLSYELECQSLKTLEALLFATALPPEPWLKYG